MEFLFLALLLMVPLVYFIITVSQVQNGSFAVVGAADQAAKVYSAAEYDAAGDAEVAVATTLADYGYRPVDAQMEISCAPSDCRAAGSAVTVTVRLRIALPFVPFSGAQGITATNVSAASTQMMGRFR
ncbi:hypothetical protein [Pseudarthrobacter sp. PS3-L1]|uniref:hypothetical protein n=1 Tax=Pseudarthrobacter sp. PS3-L1 TaxID=3046207 RepID=UPI0024B9E9A9|nr:hypothetical protein [Pseudarthrobacter sp. PS3-L1]MDJ0321518.1 hypothetical protein [Pseudarthrobacter sp. PS3-L1]